MLFQLYLLLTLMVLLDSVVHSWGLGQGSGQWTSRVYRYLTHQLQPTNYCTNCWVSWSVLYFDFDMNFVEMKPNFLENTVFGFHIKFRHIVKKLYAICYVSFKVSVSYLMRQTHGESICLASLYNFVINYI